MAVPAASDNPYPAGSARAKLWERRRQEQLKNEKPKPKAPESSDKTNRRKALDAAIEGATASRVNRMRKGQFSDESNENNFG